MIHIKTPLKNTPHKRLVFDIDDTISYTISRDWENATPNEPLINKINKLFDDGWEIYLVTARGSISCDTREKAYRKYGAQILEWLDKHNVKYHMLSFQKYLATYYIDDKGISPDNFLNLDMKVIKTGWSGATVELRDGRIYKTHPNSRDVAMWYDIAKNYINVPRVHSLIGDTICLEYIENNNNTDWKISKVIDIIKIFHKMPSTQSTNGFEKYLRRIKDHIFNNMDWDMSLIWENVSKILSRETVVGDYSDKYLDFIRDNDSFNSFCHGDLSIDNILCNNGKVYLIDPIYETNGNAWESWLVDVSKLLMSLRKNNMMYQHKHIYDIFSKYLGGVNYLNESWSSLFAKEFLNILELFHWIRLIKYAPREEQEKIYKMIIHINRKLNECKYIDCKYV